jgi:hypothetical protein
MAMATILSIQDEQNTSHARSKQLLNLHTNQHVLSIPMVLVKHTTTKEARDEIANVRMFVSHFGNFLPALLLARK